MGGFGSQAEWCSIKNQRKFCSIYAYHKNLIIDFLGAKLEKAELSIKHKDELLVQKDNEIAVLKEIIALIKKGAWPARWVV